MQRNVLFVNDFLPLKTQYLAIVTSSIEFTKNHTQISDFIRRQNRKTARGSSAMAREFHSNRQQQ